MSKTTHTKRHMSLNLSGLLRNMKGKKIRIFDDENGDTISDTEARKYIAGCQAKGWRVIPMCGEDVCEGFDHQTGCPGHVISTSENKAT